jgi:hypothetical protein
MAAGLIMFLPIAAMKSSRHLAPRLAIGGLIVFSISLALSPKSAASSETVNSTPSDAASSAFSDGNPLPTPSDVPEGVSPAVLVATIVRSAQQCDRFANFGDKTLNPDGSKPTYADIGAIGHDCLSAYKSIDQQYIAIYVNDNDRDFLKKLRGKCADAYHVRSLALGSLANSRYDYSNDQYNKPADPDKVRANDLALYQSQAADADRAIEQCKYYLHAAVREWGASTLPE